MTLHPEAAAFLAAIAANPDDDTPRLIFADWLEEHGEPERAEFVRVQVELAARSGPPFPDARGRQWLYGPNHHRGCTRKHRGKVRAFEKSGPCELCKRLRANQEYYDQGNQLRRRERELLTVGTAFGMSLNASRGFLSKVAGTWEQWQAHGDAILADPWVPGLDEVELTTPPTWEPTYTNRVAPIGIAGRQFSAIPDDKLVGMTVDDQVKYYLNRRWNYDGKPAVRSWTLPPVQEDS